MIGLDWYRNNQYPQDRLWHARDKVAEAERRLREANEELALAAKEMAAYNEFHSAR